MQEQDVHSHSGDAFQPEIDIVFIDPEGLASQSDATTQERMDRSNTTASDGKSRSDRKGEHGRQRTWPSLLMKMLTTRISVPLYFIAWLYLWLPISIANNVIHMLTVHGWPWDPTPCYATSPECQPVYQGCVLFNNSDNGLVCWNITKPDGTWTFDPASGQMVELTTNQTHF